MSDLKILGLFFVGIAIGCLFPKEDNSRIGMLITMGIGLVFLIIDIICDIRERSDRIKNA